MLNTDNQIDYDNMKDSYKHCADTIRSLKGQKVFYVGVTANPQECLDAHVADKNMKKMYTLCKVNTLRRADSIGKKLLNVFGKLKNNWNVKNNDTPQPDYGETLTGKTNYVYLLLR